MQIPFKKKPPPRRASGDRRAVSIAGGEGAVFSLLKRAGRTETRDLAKYPQRPGKKYFNNAAGLDEFLAGANPDPGLPSQLLVAPVV